MRARGIEREVNAERRTGGLGRVRLGKAQVVGRCVVSAVEVRCALSGYDPPAA